MSTKDTGILIAAVGDVGFLAEPQVKPISDVWNQADLRLGNYEAVISDKPGLPANKIFRLRGHVNSGQWLAKMGFNAVSIANNHAMDFGLPGLIDTIDNLGKAGIAFSGAGRNINEARKPAIFEVNGYRIAMLGWCSTIPPGAQATVYHGGLAGVRIISSYLVDTITTDESPGMPPWIHTKAVDTDLEIFHQAVAETAAQADFTIVSYHWGVPPQYSSCHQGPVMDYQKEVAETAKAAGADMIIGHHCHAPLGVEQIGGLPVLYSLGDYALHCTYMEEFKEITDVSSVDMIHGRLPENRHTCIAGIRLLPENGKLRISDIRFYPGRLDDNGEATAADEVTANDFRQRLIMFSAKRKATLLPQKDGSLLWQL